MLFLKKGSKIYIEGKLQTRSWDDQSGQKRYTTEVVVNELQMLDSRGEGGGGGGGTRDPGPAAQPDYAPPSGGGAEDDDLPF